MSFLSAFGARVRPWLRPSLYNLARALLVVWGLGLCVAAVQLGNWRQELSRTLMHLNADAQFRARVQHREAVDPAWYRRKALSLLSATERLQRDTTWTLFVPGSWRVIDDLEEQVQARIAREFGEIVVETIQRELYARASQLTGVPLLRGAGGLQTEAECQSPIPQGVERKLTAAAEELPEFLAIAEYVEAVERLDAAVQDFLSLQHATGQPEQLRKLVAYTLDAELPGNLAHGALLFQGSEEVSLQPALMLSRLQWATRCALGKAMSALHGRLLNTNDLFALEQGLVERSAGLFDPAARPAPFDRTLERYRAVHALLEDQHALLAKGRNDWMRHAKLQLGPGYQEMLQRIARTRLFGPEVLQQLENQSGAAFAEFRRQFESAFASHGEPGIVWLEREQRFGLSAERSGMRQGLAGLLKAPFMLEEAPPPGAAVKVRPAGSLVPVREEARNLADARLRFLSDHLKFFPANAQLAVTRVVDARVADLIYQKAYRALKAALPADSATPLDPVAFRQQREQMLAMQALLREAGSPVFGERLVAMMDGELLRRLALLHEDWQQQPLNDARGSDFGWWQGEALSVAQTIAGADAAGLQAAMARMGTRLDLLSQQAKAMLALGSPALAEDPAAQRWLRIQTELDRFHGRSADSSLLRLERYLAALGELKRENCAERLAAQLPRPPFDDEIAQRHAQIHNALANRCNELKTQAAATTPASPATPVAQ